MTKVRHFDIVVVGCGFAGAATAYHLSRSGARSLLLIDREKVPGYHASGRNASLVYQSAADPLVRRLTVLSRRSYERISSAVAFVQSGSLLLGTREELERCREETLVSSAYRNPLEVIGEIPLLTDHRFDLALETPTDGVLDIAALLRFYLEEARSRGVEIWFDRELRAIAGAAPFRLDTSRGEIATDCLVNAAGAWAARVAALTGVSSVPMTPFKRHLFVLDGVPEMAPELPYVWDLERAFYFRPESGGLLFSVCDETRARSLEPVVEPGIHLRLAEVILEELPALSGATVRKAWSCFRTKTPDGRFVIGPDPELEGFFWVAGLGGHGMGASWEVGRLAAAAISGAAQPPPEITPARFIGSR